MKRIRIIWLIVFASVCPTPRAYAQPVLNVQGDHFTVNGVPKFLLFVSYFDAMRRANAREADISTPPDGIDDANTGGLETDFGYFKSIGIDGIRIFPNWFVYGCPRPPDDGQKLFTYNGGTWTINADMQPVFLRILDRAAAHGLIVDVTFTRETYHPGWIPVADYQSLIVQVATLLKNQSGSYRHVFFDIQNEWDIAERLTTQQARDIVDAVHGVDGQRITTASGGGAAFARDSGVNFFAHHDPRTVHIPPRSHDWYWANNITPQVQTIRRTLGSALKPISFQEPMPFRRFASCTQSEDPVKEHHLAAAVHAMAAGAAAWTFHTRQSFALASHTLESILLQDRTQKEALDRLRSAVESFQKGPSHLTKSNGYIRDGQMAQ